MSYILGVDAGNSKTVALVARLDGAVVGAARRGCGDVSNRAVGVAAALNNVEAAVTTALEAAAITENDLVAQTFSMAGADWPEDFIFLHEHLSRGRDVHIVNDAVGALRAGSPDGTGVAVVCGTYAVSAARASGGATWHAGFWQETGGAFKFGEEALRAVYRTELGIDPATSLTGAVLEFFGRGSVEEVLHGLTARGSSFPPNTAARLAPVLLSEAANGDSAARAIVQSQGGILADYALAAARQVGIDTTPFKLLLTGGVFRHPSQLLEKEITARVHTHNLDITVFRSDREPVVGAVLLALEAVAVVPDPALYERLRASLPPSAFFATR
ncbi:BadF/BadG/BcrA/BcrD ATPase family protein [soil metagenome]